MGLKILVFKGKIFNETLLTLRVQTQHEYLWVNYVWNCLKSLLFARNIEKASNITIY